MILKEYAVDIPYEKGSIVIKKEKWVEMETERTYPAGKKGSRVRRVTMGRTRWPTPGISDPSFMCWRLTIHGIRGMLPGRLWIYCRLYMGLRGRRGNRTLRFADG